MTPLVAHADWSIAPDKRWMAVASPAGPGWRVRLELVRDVPSLLGRIQTEAAGGPAAFGIDVPIGLPRAYVERHVTGFDSFPTFLDGLQRRPDFFKVCLRPEEIEPLRPFFPSRAQRGVRRDAHATALGLAKDEFFRACERGTNGRRAAAPLFWTLGANQVGKAALSAWQELLLPARASQHPPGLWPFEGTIRELLQPGRVMIAEAYPAEALLQVSPGFTGSKRRQADRRAIAATLQSVMTRLDAVPDPECASLIEHGFGTDKNGEDRFDSLVGLLGMLLALHRRPNEVRDDGWVRDWEGWIFGQA